MFLSKDKTEQLVKKADKQKKLEENKKSIHIDNIKAILKEWVLTHEETTKSKFVNIHIGNLNLSENDIHYEQNPKVIESDSKVEIITRKTFTNNTGKEKKYTGELVKTVSSTKSHTFSSDLSAGISAGFYGASASVNANLHYEKSTSETETYEARIGYDVDVPANHTAEVSLKLKKTPKIDKFAIDLIADGFIEVEFKEKEKLLYDTKNHIIRKPNINDNAEIKNSHHTVKIIATDILHILQNQKPELKCSIDGASLRVTLEGECTSYMCTEELITDEPKSLVGNIHSKEVEEKIEIPIQQGKTNLTAIGFNNTTFEGEVIHGGIKQSLYDLETDTWDAEDKDTVDKAIHKVGDMKTEMCNNSTFKEKVEIKAVENVGVKVKRMRGATPETIQPTQAQLLSEQGSFKPEKLTMDDRKLLRKAGDLIEEVSSKNYINDEDIADLSKNLKGILGTHREKCEKLTPDTIKEINDHIEGIEEFKSSMDNKINNVKK